MRKILLSSTLMLTAGFAWSDHRAARVDKIGASSEAEAAGVIDEWVGAFQDKDRQIAVQHSQPASPPASVSPSTLRVAGTSPTLGVRVRSPRELGDPIRPSMSRD